MKKEAVLRARIAEDEKQAGEKILREIGLTNSDFLLLCWRQMVARGAMPVELYAPSRGPVDKDTLRTTQMALMKSMISEWETLQAEIERTTGSKVRQK